MRVLTKLTSPTDRLSSLTCLYNHQTRPIKCSKFIQCNITANILPTESIQLNYAFIGEYAATHHISDRSTDGIGLILSGHTACGLIYFSQVQLDGGMIFSCNDSVAS